jgi:hypothetical protein
MAESCEIRVVKDRAEWDELFDRVEHPHLVQTWAYGEAKLEAGDHSARRSLIDVGGWNPRRVVFTRDGEPVALCQFLDKCIASLAGASRINRGPLFIGEPDADTVRSVYGALKSRRHRRCGALVLAPALEETEENVRLLEGLGFRCRDKAGWVSTRVGIDMTPDELRAHVSCKWRNRLKVAERAEFTFRELPGTEGLEWMIERHIENMQDKGFEGPSPALLRALYRAAPGRVLVFQALLCDEPAGGMLVYRFGRGAEYYVGWMGTEGKQFSVGNYLYWNIALELQRRGCDWIDLGGQRPGHTEQFKRGMRGTEYQLLNEWLAI